MKAASSQPPRARSMVRAAAGAGGSSGVDLAWLWFCCAFNTMYMRSVHVCGGSKACFCSSHEGRWVLPRLLGGQASGANVAAWSGGDERPSEQQFWWCHACHGNIRASRPISQPILASLVSKKRLARGAASTRERGGGPSSSMMHASCSRSSSPAGRRNGPAAQLSAQ